MAVAKFGKWRAGSANVGRSYRMSFWTVARRSKQHAMGRGSLLLSPHTPPADAAKRTTNVQCGADYVQCACMGISCLARGRIACDTGIQGGVSVPHSAYRCAVLTVVHSHVLHKSGTAQLVCVVALSYALASRLSRCCRSLSPKLTSFILSFEE